jgi:hypothetical protein
MGAQGREVRPFFFIRGTLSHDTPL